MSALQEADKALDDFLCGYMADDTNTCEQHEFREAVLQKQVDDLLRMFNNAWYIVEGFQFTSPPEAEW